MHKLIVTSAVIMFFLGTAGAQSSYQPYLLGLRTAGMGGAAAAFGSDSAMSWVNPAGMARSRDGTLSVSANAYTLEELLSYDYYSMSDQVRQSLGIPMDASRSEMSSYQFSAFPSSLSYTLSLGLKGDHVLALSVIVPYKRSMKRFTDWILNIGGVNYLMQETDRRVFTQYEIGPTYALRLEKITLGLSVFFRYVPGAMDWSSDSIWFAPGNVNFNPSQNRARTKSYDLDFVGGVQLGPFWGGFYAGLSIHSPSVHVGGSFRAESQSYISGNDPDTNEAIADVYFNEISEDDYNFATPFWLTVGLGYEREDSFALSLDVSCFLPYEFTSLSGTQYNSHISSQNLNPGGPETHVLTDALDFSTDWSRKTIVNVNLGAEYVVTSRLVLRAGFFTDFSPEQLPGEMEREMGDVGRYAIDRFGGTLGVAYTGNSTQFQISLVFLGGLGKIVGYRMSQVDSNANVSIDFPLREIASNTYMLVFSGELDTRRIFKNAKDVIKEEQQNFTSSE